MVFVSLVHHYWRYLVSRCVLCLSTVTGVTEDSLSSVCLDIYKVSKFYVLRLVAHNFQVMVWKLLVLQEAVVITPVMFSCFWLKVYNFLLLYMKLYCYEQLKCSVWANERTSVRFQQLIVCYVSPPVLEVLCKCSVCYVSPPLVKILCTAGLVLVHH